MNIDEILYLLDLCDGSDCFGGVECQVQGTTDHYEDYFQ